MTKEEELEEEVEGEGGEVEAEITPRSETIRGLFRRSAIAVTLLAGLRNDA